jgi:hypothetical protein
MIVVVIVGAVAAALAVARGGSLRSVAETRFRWVWVLIAALVVQVIFEFWSPSWLAGRGAFVLLLCTSAAVVVFLAANLTLPGILLAGIGLVINLGVIGLNDGMPVSQHAANVAGVSENLSDVGFKHHRLDGDTKLPWLADVIPVPGSRLIFSVGDLVLALGIGRLVYARAMSGAKTPARA